MLSSVLWSLERWSIWVAIRLRTFFSERPAKASAQGWFTQRWHHSGSSDRRRDRSRTDWERRFWQLRYTDANGIRHSFGYRGHGTEHGHIDIDANTDSDPSNADRHD